MLSVIVTTYNRDEILRETLRGYLKQSAPELIRELIIVDDGSDCRAINEKIVSEFRNAASFRVRYVYQQNKGPAQARNTAIDLAADDILLITGDDIVPHEDLVRQHFLEHEKKLFNPMIAVLGRIIWPDSIRVTPFMEYINEMGLQFGYSIIENPKDVGFNFFYTSNISVSKNVFIKGGYFDTDFRYAAWEDIELSYRLAKIGLKIVYNSSALGYHFHDISFKSFRSRQEKCGYAANIFFYKHPELKEFLKIDQANEKSWPVYTLYWLAEKYCIMADRLSIASSHQLYEIIMNHYYYKGIRCFNKRSSL